MLRVVSSEDPQGTTRDQVTLDVEGVVDGRISREEAFAEPGDLNCCIFRSRCLAG
jgi:hypothetical protein